jgi:hypothetical protein
MPKLVLRDVIVTIPGELRWLVQDVLYAEATRLEEQASTSQGTALYRRFVKYANGLRDLADQINPIYKRKQQ